MSTQSTLASIGLMVPNSYWWPERIHGIGGCNDTNDIKISEANATTVGLFILPFVGVAARQSEVPA